MGHGIVWRSKSGRGCELICLFLFIAMQRLVDVEVDSDFNIHTSYHNDFFLLRTRVLVNGENAKICSVKEGSYEEPVMSFSHDGITISTKLWLIANTISPILHKCGIYHVDTFYYEQSPLFHVVFSSESCLKKFLQEISDVKHLMEAELLSMFSQDLKTESPQWLTTIVQPDLFLVSPSQCEVGEAEVHLVTAENCSTFVAHWKDSKLFNFGSLHWEESKFQIYTIRLILIKQRDKLSEELRMYLHPATTECPS